MRAVNLIPADQRGGTSVGAGQSEGAVYAVLGLIAGVAVLALLYGLAAHRISSSRKEAADLTAQAQRAEAAEQQLAPYTSFIAMRQQRMQAVQTLIDSRFDWAHVFHEFGRVLPLGISIGTIEGTVGTAAPGGVAGSAASASASPSSSSSAAGASSTSSPAGSAPGGASVASATPAGSVPLFTISGCATTQREVAVMLERLRLIDGVSEVTLQSSTKSLSSGGSGASGPCPAHTPAFTLQMTFDALPASPGASHAAAAVAQAGAAATSAGSAK